MKEVFKNYYPIPENKYSDIWNDAIFIFDTNILLNLFRYPKEARNDFLKILPKIKSRVHIPFIAGLEFFENIESVTKSQINAYEQIYGLFEKVGQEHKTQSDNLVLNIKKLNLENRHFSISEKKLIEEIQSNSQSYLQKLQNIQEEYSSAKKKSSLKIDDIKKEHSKLLQKLESLFKNRVGKALPNQEAIDKIDAEAKKRYERLIPPGYRDISKSRNSNKRYLAYNSLVYKREYCDFYLWKEIIDLAKKSEKKIVNIILITDDVKEDWWRITNGETKGPRIELIDEIKHQSQNKVKNFLMYNSLRFLEFAVKKYNLKVNKNTLSQIKLVQEKLTDGREIANNFSEAFNCYYEYLLNTKIHSSIEREDRPNEFIETDDALDLNFYDVRIKFSNSFSLKAVIDVLLKKMKDGHFAKYQTVNLVILEFSKYNYEQNITHYHQLTKELSNKIKVQSHLLKFIKPTKKFTILN